MVDGRCFFTLEPGHSRGIGRVDSVNNVRQILAISDRGIREKCSNIDGHGRTFLASAPCFQHLRCCAQLIQAARIIEFLSEGFNCGCLRRPFGLTGAGPLNWRNRLSILHDGFRLGLRLIPKSGFVNHELDTMIAEGDVIDPLPRSRQFVIFETNFPE